MKATKNILTIFLLGLFIGFSGFTKAQEKNPGPPPIPDEAQIAKMIEKLSAELKLSDKQSETLKVLHQEHFKKVKLLHEKHLKQMEAAREENDKLRTEFETEIEKQLSKEQFEKFKQVMDEKHKHNRPGRKHPKK